MICIGGLDQIRRNPSPMSSSSSSSGEDRLSPLPDELLHRILSFIPSTKLHAQTSLLSSRFRHLWTHHPSIHLPTSSHLPHLLLSSAAPSLHLLSLHLPLPPPECPSYPSASPILQFIRTRPVNTLSLSSSDDDPLPIVPSPFLFPHCRHVTQLQLTSFYLSWGPLRLRPSSLPLFPSLKSLSLGCCAVLDRTLAALLSNCPLLHRLVLFGLSKLNLVDLSAAALRNLKHLVVVECDRSVRVEIGEDVALVSLETDTPLVVVGPGIALLSSFSSLVRLKLFVDSRCCCWNGVQWMDLVSAFTNVTSLSINNWVFEFGSFQDYPSGSQLHVIRNIKWVTEAMLNYITPSSGCPFAAGRLKYTEKHFKNFRKELSTKASTYYQDYNRDLSVKFTSLFRDYINHQRMHLNHGNHSCAYQAKFFKDCGASLYYLKTIRVRNFLGTDKEMGLLEYLLAKAVSLERMTVMGTPSDGREVLEKRITSLPRASAYAKVFVRC